MYSNTSRFRADAHLASFDFSEVLQRFPPDCLDYRMNGDPVFERVKAEVRMRFLPSMLVLPARLSFSQKMAVASRLLKIDGFVKDSIAPSAAHAVSTRLPNYLQMVSEGELLYVPTLPYEETLRPRNMTVGEVFAGRAYEVRFRLPRLCEAIRSAYEDITGSDDLRGISLRNAAVIMEITSQFSEEKGAYRDVAFSLLFPKQNGKSARSVYVEIGLSDPSVTVEDAIRETLHDKRPDLALKAETLDAMLTCLAASADIASGALVQHPAINPHATLAARAENAGLPQKQRNKARYDLAGAPNVAFIPVARAGETPLGLNGLLALSSLKKESAAGSAPTPQWRSSIAYASEVEVSDDPRARNPHGQMHPQTIEAVFPALGRDAMAIYEAALDAPEAAISEAPAVSVDKMQISVRQSTIRSLDDLMAIYNGAIQRVPVEDRPADMLGIQQMLMLHEVLIDYRKAGAQCFLLNGDAEQLMAKTDIAAIAMTDLKLPYDALYLTFENKVQMVLDGEQVFLEGAYLSGSTAQIDVHMVFQRTDAPVETIADLCPSVMITLPRRADMTLDAAILEAIETGGYDLECAAVNEATPDDLDAAEAHGISIVPIDETSQTKLARRNERVFDTMIEALTVIANSMMLMTAAPDEITVLEAWAELSKDVAHQLKSPSAKGRERGRKAAQRENAMPVRIISLSAAAKQRLSEALATVRKSPAEAYWRRGHWRMQAYGKGRALRKWTWIEAVLCNGDADLRRAGSVYVASADQPPVE